MQVLIFPTAGKLPYLNYVKTVEYAVDKIKFVDLLDPLEQELFLYSQRSHFGIWGVTDGNNNKNLDLWKQSEIGDTCLFYRNRKFYSKGKIFAKIENQNLSLQLWNKGQKGEIWKNIYFIEFLENIDIPISKLAQSVYAPGQSVIRTFQIIRSTRSAAILKICGEQIRHKSRKEIFAERIEAIGSVTDSYVDYKRRLEQDILVDYLFQDSLETPCAICSKLYPNEFLVAGHIKKRSLATSK